jgi:hypothetical protein
VQIAQVVQRHRHIGQVGLGVLTIPRLSGLYVGSSE